MPRRVADERRDGLARVDPVRLAVGVPLRARQQVTVAVPDLATDDIARRGDQERVVGPTDEIGRPDDLPVAGRRRRGRRTPPGARRRAGRRRGRSVSPEAPPRGPRGSRHAPPEQAIDPAATPARRRGRLDAAVGQGEQQADDDGVGQQRRAAVADERQGDPGQRDELEVARGDDERLDADDQGQPGRQERPEVVGRRRRDAQPALDDDEVDARGSP